MSWPCPWCFRGVDVRRWASAAVACTAPPPRTPPPNNLTIVREVERERRIAAEGWDRFAPVSETNRPPDRPPGASPAAGSGSSSGSEDEDDE